MDTYKVLIWNPEIKRPLGRTRKWWEGNSKINHKLG
jgi:hypothetical protein